MRKVGLSVALVTAIGAMLPATGFAATPTATSSVTAGPPASTPSVVPTPAPVRTPIADLGINTDGVLGLIDGAPIVSWRDLGPGVSYALSGKIYVVRVNAADPFCTRASVDESRTIDVDQATGEGVHQISLALPPLPAGELWFAFDVSLVLRATDASGAEIGAQGVGGTAEAACARLASSPVAVSPPAAGYGVGGGQGGAKAAVLLAVVLTGIGGAALTAGRRARR